LQNKIIFKIFIELSELLSMKEKNHVQNESFAEKRKTALAGKF